MTTAEKKQIAILKLIKLYNLEARTENHVEKKMIQENIKFYKKLLNK